MKLKLDNEKRNMLRRGVFINYRPAIVLEQKIGVIHQVKLELNFLQVLKKIPIESYNELIGKYDRQIIQLYEEFHWNSLKKKLDRRSINVIKK